MTKQSNPFQRLIKKIYDFMEDSGGAVTESVLVEDADGIEREVDILIESKICGETVCIAVECRDHKRPVTITWIDDLSGKFLSLKHKIHKVIAVSSSGFSKNAILRANREGIKTHTLAEAENLNWSEEFKRLGLAYFNCNYRPLSIRLFYKKGAVHNGKLDMSTKVCTEDGQESTINDLAAKFHENTLRDRITEFFETNLKEIFHSVANTEQKLIHKVPIGPISIPPGLYVCPDDNTKLPLDSIGFIMECRFEFKPISVQHKKFGNALITQGDFTAENLQISVIQGSDKSGKAKVAIDVISEPEKKKPKKKK